jgi:hypothetical protein
MRKVTKEIQVVVDYEAAAEAAKQDYNEVQLFGNTFFIRA